MNRSLNRLPIHRVRMAERSKALRSGRSLVLQAWVRIPLLTYFWLCLTTRNLSSLFNAFLLSIIFPRPALYWFMVKTTFIHPDAPLKRKISWVPRSGNGGALTPTAAICPPGRVPLGRRYLIVIDLIEIGM